MSACRILILEDCPHRHTAFKRLFAHAKVLKIVDTAKDCIDQLINENWDELYLDHDLGGETFVDSTTNGNTGYAVACWLEENPGYKPPKIVIHSLNPSGAHRMQQALPGVPWIPGAWLGTAVLISDKD